jgi:hypothetical protein
VKYNLGAHFSEEMREARSPSCKNEKEEDEQEEEQKE